MDEDRNERSGRLYEHGLPRRQERSAETVESRSGATGGRLKRKLRGWGARLARRYIKTPQIQVVGIKIVEGGLLEQSYKVKLRLYNPNRIALPVKVFRYRVELVGERFLKGQTEAPFRIPARGATEFEVSARTSLVRLGRSLVNLLMRPYSGVDYCITGDIDLGLPLLRGVPFSYRGNVDVLR